MDVSKFPDLYDEERAKNIVGDISSRRAAAAPDKCLGTFMDSPSASTQVRIASGYNDRTRVLVMPDGETEYQLEIVGVLWRVDLPPVGSDYQSATLRRARQAKQGVAIVAFDNPLFAAAMRNIEHIRNLFQRSIGRRVTTSAPTQTRCGKAIGFASRYFSHVKDADPASVESVPENIDPFPQRYLQAMLESYGQLVYTNSNSVEYYIASGEGPAGALSYTECPPSTFQVGDVVAVTISFVAVPQFTRGAEADWYMLKVLRGIALLDDGPTNPGIKRPGRAFGAQEEPTDKRARPTQEEGNDNGMQIATHWSEEPPKKKRKRHTTTGGPTSYDVVAFSVNEQSVDDVVNGPGVPSSGPAQSGSSTRQNEAPTWEYTSRSEPDPSLCVHPTAPIGSNDLATTSEASHNIAADFDQSDADGSSASVHSLDLTSNVAVRHGTPTTWWQSVNAITYLPYHTTDNPRVNVLAWDANCVDLCAKMFPSALERPDMLTVLTNGPVNDILDQAVASLEQGVSVLVKGGGLKVPQVSGRDDVDDAMTPQYWGCRFPAGGGLGLDLHTPLEVHDMYLREVETQSDKDEAGRNSDSSVDTAKSERASSSTIHKHKGAPGPKRVNQQHTPAANPIPPESRTMMSLNEFHEYIQDGSNPPRCILELLPGLPSSDAIIEQVLRSWQTYGAPSTGVSYTNGASLLCLISTQWGWAHQSSTATFANLAERMKHVVAGASKYGASRGDFHIPNSDWTIGPDNGAILILEEGDLFRVRNGERFRRKSMLALCLMILWPDRYIPRASQAPARAVESERSDGGRLLARFLKGYGKWARLDIDNVAVSVCERVIHEITPRRGKKESPSAWYTRAREYNVDGAHWQHPGDYIDLSYLL
ncbi:uncharacterized protein SCHCODRAFT_02598345 [Schizophyllum commune H4-8]|uniref:Uncharacterized protein n=1 Tax=Schizophyllum commune (strain H4-8 / FGSC 9210) TaxID=578458 RepID=D8PY59_SCHCM|nr:uncharacterized protein SCHCODRAFT_02598345 [Schizophyllum commune H4-8]KAI5895180.1 hypothetical protein SCHCODRAFT_02598345 [Schizophyllum commune H4-8]